MKTQSKIKYIIFPWESLVMLKVHSFKNSISLALFHRVCFIEIVIIVSRQSLPLAHLENNKLKNYTLNMLCNILLLDFQVTTTCNTCVFYMHMVTKCIGALDVSHNAQMNWPQQMPS